VVAASVVAQQAIFAQQAKGREPVPVKDREKAEQRLNEASVTLNEIMTAKDKGIPQDLLEKAECVVVVPGLKKGAFVIGGEFGKGYMSCRKGASWSAPAAIRVEGGSVGFQIGGSETDLVMLVMNQEGANKLMGDQFTLGGEGAVAGGPVGRNATADTDARLRAEILSWSRSRGAFAGVSVKGATVRTDKDENYALYGSLLGTRDVIYGRVTPTPAGKHFIATLAKYSTRPAPVTTR
jgi:lipid-binding SYLF domain-containing protein